MLSWRICHIFVTKNIVIVCLQNTSNVGLGKLVHTPILTQWSSVRLEIERLLVRDSPGALCRGESRISGKGVHMYKGVRDSLC